METYPIQKATLKQCLRMLDIQWERLQRTSHYHDLLYYQAEWDMLDALTIENGLELHRGEDGRHYLKETGYMEVQIPLDKHGDPIENIDEFLAKITPIMVEE